MEDAVSLVKHVGVRLLPWKHQLKGCTLIQLPGFGMWEDVSGAHEFQASSDVTSPSTQVFGCKIYILTL